MAGLVGAKYLMSNIPGVLVCLIAPRPLAPGDVETVDLCAQALIDRNHAISMLCLQNVAIRTIHDRCVDVDVQSVSAVALEGALLTAVLILLSLHLIFVSLRLIRMFCDSDAIAYHDQHLQPGLRTDAMHVANGKVHASF